MMKQALAKFACSDTSLVQLCGAGIQKQTAGEGSLSSLVTCAEHALKAEELGLANRLLETYFANSTNLRDQYFCRALFVLSQITSEKACKHKGDQLVAATLAAVDIVLRGIQIAAQNPRQGLRSHILTAQQTVVDAVRKVPDQQKWLSSLLLQLALSQLEVNRGDDALKSVDEAQQLSRSLTAPGLLNQAATTQAHVLQAFGKTAKGLKAKAPIQPAGGKGSSKAKDGSMGQAVDAAVQREEEAGILAAVQSVTSGAASDAAAAEERLKEILEQCEVGQGGIVRGGNLKAVAQVGWAAALLDLADLAERCASRAAGSQDIAPRTWADLIRAQQQIAQDQAARGRGAVTSNTPLLKVIDTLGSTLHAFLGCQDVDGVHNACRLVWNAALPLLDQPPSKQLKTALASAAQALASVASPLHHLRALLHLETAKGDMADDLLTKAATEIKKAQALDYLAGQQEQQQWDLERPLDRYIEPLDQALTIKAAVKDSSTDSENAMLLMERGRESKIPATRGQHLSQALQKLAALPAVKPPLPTDANGSQRKAQHAAARLRTKQYCDIATLAWESKLEGVVREACPLALAIVWSAEVDPEVVRWQAEVSLLEAKAAVAACQKQRALLIEPPSAAPAIVLDPATAARKPSGDLASLQQLVAQAFLTAMKLSIEAKQPWLVCNSAVAIWNTYLPNLQQQLFAPLRDLLVSATTMLLNQADTGSLAAQLKALATAAASAAEHTALLAVRAATEQTGSFKTTMSLTEARKLAAPLLATAGSSPAAVPSPAKAARAAPKADVAQGLIPATAVMQLKQAAESCEAVMLKLSSASNAAGGQQLLEAYARVQQLRGMPNAAPTSISPALQPTSKVIALIESLSSLNSQDAGKHEADIQQALTSLAAQQPISLELHGKLAKATLQAGATAAAMQTATALLAAALPHGRAFQDVLDPADAPGVATGDWQWLAVGSLVLGQAVLLSNQSSLASQLPASQIQLRKVSMGHLLAAARFASFAGQAELLESAAKAYWNTTIELMSSASGRSIIMESLQELAELMCERKCPDANFQVEVVCLMSQCMADEGRWEDGLKLCEAAMGILASAVHLRLSTWKVVFLSMLGRSVVDEMARITERGSQHGAAAWLCIANHAVQPEEQLHARQQAVHAVQKANASVKAHYMAALGEWLVQQGTAREAGKEILLGAAALLEPPMPATVQDEEQLSRSSTLASTAGDTISQHASAAKGMQEGSLLRPEDGTKLGLHGPVSQQMQAADLDLLFRICMLLIAASNTRLEQCKYATKAQGCMVALLQNSIDFAESSQASGDAIARVPRDWLAFQLTPQVLVKLSLTTDDVTGNKASITNPQLTVRCVDQLIETLQQLGLHILAVPLCHVEHLLAGAILHSPALASASQLKLAALAEALVLPDVAAKAEKQAGPFLLSAAESDGNEKMVATREYLIEAQIEIVSASGASSRRSRKGKRGHGPDSRAAMSSSGSNRTGNKALASRSSPAWADHSIASNKNLQACSEAEAWLQQGEYLALHGQYAPAKELLMAALSHFQAFGQLTASARALLAQAQLEQLANQPQAAMQLVQQAQKAGGDVATCCKAVHCYAELCCQLNKQPDAVAALQSGIDMLDSLTRSQPAVAVKAKEAAASLYMQLGWVHLLQQSQEAGMLPGLQPPEAALHCFQQAAARVQAFGASHLHVEACVAQVEVMLSHSLSKSNHTAVLQDALKIVEAAESEAEQLRQEAVAVSPAPMAATGSTQPVAAVAQPAAATRASSPQPRGLSPLPQAPGPQPPAADPLALSLPAARLLAKVQTIKAEALLAAAHAMQDKQEDAAKFAVPGKDAVAVKQFLAQAGILTLCSIQEPGSVPGYYEQQAVQAATSAQELSPDPAQLCRAQLALGRAYVALYNLKLGSEVADSDMWLDHDQSAAEAVEVAADAAKATAAQQEAASSFQLCIASALQAGDLSSAVAAAEETVACLGNADRQTAAEALLTAQSCRAVADMEAIYQAAAPPQAQEQLLLRLRTHLQAHLPAAPLTSAWQQLLQKLQREACMGPRLALTPSALDILQSMPPTTQIICLHLTQDGSHLYCTVLKGQQSTAAPLAAKAKAGKQAEAPAQTVKSVALTRLALVGGALEALAAKLKRFVAAKEQHLLVTAGTTAPKDAAETEGLAQEWQDVVSSLEAFLGPVAALLTPGPAVSMQQANPVLLLLDHQLHDLPFEWLPQLKQATAVIRDFSLHVQHSRTTAAATRQGIATKQLSYIVDPCSEHAPAPAVTPPAAAPAPAKAGSKPAQKGAPGSSAAADKANRSLLQAFQQDVLSLYGKEWTGITGNVGCMPTDAQYEQLLRQATGFLYCGVGRFVNYVPPAAVVQTDLRSCELAVLLDRSQTAKSVKRQLLQQGKREGVHSLIRSADIAQMLTMQGVQSVVLHTMPSSVSSSPDCCIQLLQGLGQSKSVGEVVHSVREDSVGGLVVYGMVSHKAVTK